MPVGRLFYEIGGDTSKLNESLKQAMDVLKDAGVKATAAGKSIISSFDDAINPTKRLAEQIQILTLAGKSDADIIAVMGDRFLKAADAARANGQAVDPLVKKMEDLALQAKESGLSFESLGQAITNFAEHPLQAVQQGLSGFLETLGPTVVGIAGLVAGLAAAGAAVLKVGEEIVAGAIRMTSASAEESLQLKNLSASTGLTTQQLQALQRIGQEAGLESLNLSRTLGMLNQQLAHAEAGEAGGGFTKALKDLRIALEDAGKPKDVITLLDELREKLLAIHDPAEQAQAAQSALGGRLRELIPLVLGSKESFAQMIAEVQKDGLVFDNLTNIQLLHYHDSLIELNRKYDEIVMKLQVALLPVMTTFADMLVRLSKHIDANGASFRLLGLAISYPIQYLLALGVAFSKTVESMLQGQVAILGMVTAINKALGPASPLYSFQGVVNASLPIYIKGLEAAKGASELFQGTLDTVNNSILQMGRANMSVGPTLDMLGTATTHLTAEQQKLQEEVTKSLRPLSALTAEFQKQATAGMDLDSFVKIHAQEIIKTGEAQKELLQPMSDLDKQMLSLAEAFATATGKLKEFKAAGKDIADTGDAISETLIKAEEKFDKFIALNPMKDLMKTPDQQQLDKDWAASESILVGHATSASKQVTEAMNRTFNSMERGIAKSIVHWKGFADTIKSVFQDLAIGLIETLEKHLFAPLETMLGKLIDSILGIGKSAAGGGSGGGLGGIIGSLGGLLGAVGIPLVAAGAAAGGSMFPGPTWADIIAGGAVGAIGTIGAVGAIGGAAGGIGAGAGALGSLAGFFTNPVTAIPAIVAIALPFVIDAIQGKNAWQAGAPEAWRDFKINITDDQFKQFATSLGLSESQTYPIRKDLMSSPLFLTQVAAPLAKAQGTFDQFEKSLETVTTSWGTFNFRTAFDLGQTTGDFSELNKEFDEAFSKSGALVSTMPDFATKLAAVASATTTTSAATQSLTDGFTALKNAFLGSITPAETMFDTFLKTGTITDALAAKITELGGNLATFQKYTDVSSGLAPLEKQLSFITSLSQGIQGLAPQLDPIKQLLSGNMSTDVISALTGAGISPDKLTGLTGTISQESGWDAAVKALQSAGTLSPDLKAALLQYGGDAGQSAVAKFSQGFNTITQSLLDATKAAMDTSYQQQIKDALGYLGTLQQQTTDAITTLQKSISDAATDVVAEIDKILSALTSTTAAVTTTASTTTTTTTASTNLNGGLPEDNSLNTDDNTGRTGINGDYYDMRGATVYGYEDFAKQVAQANMTNARRLGIPALA